MYHYPLLRHPRPAPPRVVILPPSSSSSTASDFSSASTVSSALSSAATVDSTRSKNAQLRARFFEQRAQEGGEEKAADEQRTEQTTPSGRPSTSPRVRSCGNFGECLEKHSLGASSARIPPPPLPEQHTPFAAVQQGQRPWWRDRHEQQRENGEEGKWGWTTGRWWGGLKGRREEEKGATENSSPSPSRQKPKFVYTSSRKSNKEARMEQGPREYESCKDIGIDFCARTSSHGIPFVGTHSFFGRPFWALVTTIAFCSFIIQTYFTLSDYIEYRTIIEMQLKFEPAPFPAATMFVECLSASIPLFSCNLNAFKLSEVRKFEEIEQGIKHWEKAISTLNRLKEATGTRRRRQVVYRPVYVRCVCRMPDDQCTPQRNLMDRNASVCLCYEDADTGDIWPCYLYTVWKEKKCSHCSNSNTCDDPDKPPNITSLVTKPRDPPVTCLCQPISHYCLLLEPNSEIHWQVDCKIGQQFSPPISDVEQAFGLEDLKDRGAITTKTKENVIFLVAGMSREVRQSLSYTLDEFVLRCSFNSKDCDLQRDFQIQIDPEYGNCWTFNFNDSVELKNSRAGPMYGLRLLLNVNQSDYMPTTEAAGVRIVVHEQDQEPFPDTFGYSAPTGFVSSFGLKTKILNRLDAPYGKCSDTFRPEGYIYAEHYSPEGCYRNCFQHSILERCGCGDPRFPLPNENEDRACDARNPRERTCLAEQTSVLGGFHHLTHDCLCVQPCTEHVFETAYSAAAWPALNFNIGGDDCSLVLGPNFTLEECTEYYRQNTALIEIYYEQLNYEKLKETPGYTLVNLFSDLGGNIGLWIGFSLITVMEVVELIFECLTFGLKNCVYRPLRKKAMNRRASHADDALLRHQSSVSTSHQSVAFSEGPGREPGGGGGHPPLVRRVSGRSSTQRRGYVRPPLRKWRSNVPTSIDEKPGDESADRNASVQHGEQYTYTYTFGPGGSDAGGGASTAVGRTPERAGSGSAKVQFAQHK